MNCDKTGVQYVSMKDPFVVRFDARRDVILSKIRMLAVDIHILGLAGVSGISLIINRNTNQTNLIVAVLDREGRR